MSHSYSPRTRLGHKAASPSPLRQTSTASNGSSTYSGDSNRYPPSRSSTLSSNGSTTFQPVTLGHRRGKSEGTTLTRSQTDYFIIPEKESKPSDTYASMRKALRPLQQVPQTLPSPPSPQSPQSSPIPEKPARATNSPTRPHTHTRAQSVDPSRLNSFDGSTSPPAKPRPLSIAISRSDSIRAPTRDHSARPLSTAHLDRPELQRFQKSSTGHLRTLSKFAETASEDDFTIKSPEQEVVGLHGRRRLQRTDSARGKKATSSWASRNWMDQQRQFLQAYEYLCHIGEAKEWIEDIIHKDIPPVVEMEEALRDGVTLAEVVQSIQGRALRIFRDPKLQWRHSNNYAHFFKFLADVELPDLFRFELVDLYEKKNIPKVIYCIHALSWLLFRKGMVDFRIGNLVGKLQFEDHELEAMQKGLDKAGVSMPNFSGMSAKFEVEPEPEPEPVESEEDRIDRELSENETVIVDLQAQVRGAIVRIRLGNMMQHLWDNEELIVDLQSRIRGDWARQITYYRLDMRRFAVSLQSAARGFLFRSRLRGEEEYWRDKQPQILKVQNLFRGRKARAEVQFMKSKILQHENGIREFQAAIRGALQRMRVGDRYEQTREAEPTVLHIQSMIRGALVRHQVDRDYAELKENESQIVDIQAALRAMFIRQTMRADLDNLRQQESIITLLQAAARGALGRKHNAEVQDKLVSTNVNWSGLQSKARGNFLRSSLLQLQEELQAELPHIIDLQAVARGGQLRSEVANTLAQLNDEEPVITSLQSYMRGFLSRQRHFSDLKALQAQTPTILDLQSACRGFMQRQRTYETLCELNSQEAEIIQLQAVARGVNLRMHIGNILAQVEEHEDVIVELQALARGMIVRQKFTEKKKFYKENMEKVIKIQSFVRGRQQGEAYKSLTSGKNPPVSTVKNFVHLLNDSDIDFDEEIEFERLRKTVVQHVRQNELAEQYIDQLDIKIALLVKNKITLDEVVKHQKHFGGHVGTLLSTKDISSKDPFDLKALNKNSRRKLEHYQELFFILQTQPQYMARLFKRLREQGLANKDTKRIEQLTMSLFGLAQKRREEYYLLKLMSRSLKEEVDGCASIQEFVRSNFFWAKLFNSYVRSPRDRKFLKDLFGPLIKENIIDNEHLDLESDPMQIYRSAINNEELSTGQQSRRDPNVSRDQAIKDPETRETFIHHLQDLRDIADQFFSIIEEVLHRMPFGVRYLAQQMFEELRLKFPYEPQEQLLQVVGQWVWKSYMQPALLQPQHWGVVDRGLSPLMNRNLGEVSKVLGQVAAGRLFGGENVYLQPLNSYITEAIDRLQDVWSNLINVRDAEAQFEIDEFNDLFARVKPTLYIKLADIFAIHNLVVDDLPTLCPSQDDPLREVIRELGSAKNNESELLHVSSTEITLTLNPKFHEQEDPEADIKALFMETKRYILYIIRIQTGANLTEIMVKPVTPDDEDRWDALVRDEIAAQMKDRNRKLRSSAASTYTTDMSSTSVFDLDYPSLKRCALENILHLQRAGRISPHNHYQDLLNAIAVDIRTKHRRRIQRAKELEGVRATLSALDDKAHFLESQLKSYNDYVEQAMVTLQNKRGKKKFLLPFTKQYNHMRELQRSGREYRFGSFKYSARNLADKGILVSWNGFAERTWDRLDITISSNQIGIFEIQGSQGSMMIPGAFAEVPLDGLLQAQFENHQFMNLFCGESAAVQGKKSQGTGGEGVARVNVNLFLHLIFKKFYRDQ
ncbi:ras GTPase activating protein-like protein [Bimuria novae-zelandiae CBS 107.79]|uniref:Ras GTPase activating protein-like protein n=1 Tax=Bimuria novae-zelandiae CBS 107.79 TaxID=1447943 RepID=A0A6A5V074_9PLEO|nr:ras GTPase activating protein-like protein [Bimuria novae-zelandiae CBS 107.79]